MNPRDTAVQHLGQIIQRWPDLQDALTARQATGWPPVMGIAALTRTAEDREQAATDRAAERSPDQLGARPVPISIDVLDVMRTVEEQLVAFTDVVASQIQRAPMSAAPRGAGWTPKEIARRDQLAAEDAADTRRWRYRGQRTAAYAAGWLRARLGYGLGADGPFRPLTDVEVAHIASVAQAAADAIDRALHTARQTRRLDRPCPHCRGVLELHGGDGTDPTVTCTTCGWTRTTTAVA